MEKLIATRYTKRFRLRTPVVLAPMYYASETKLVGAVSSAGGFGILPVGFDSAEKVTSALRSLRQQLSTPDDQPVPVGVGFLGWILDRTEVSDEPRIPKVLDENPAVAWLAFGSDLGKYVQSIRQYDESRGRGDLDKRTKIWVIVNSVEQALVAASDWKVDGLVVQGYEAGGHGGAAAPPLFNLLPAVLSALPPPTEELTSPLVIAAGGVSTGSQIASLLTIGADAVALGTRFLFTPESIYSDAFKSTLVAADLNATKRSYAFDEVGGTPPKLTWPEGIDGRAIVNDIVKDSDDGVDLAERKKRFDEGKKAGDGKRALVWAGVGAGQVNEIKPAKDVLTELHEATVKSLNAVKALI